MVIGKKGQMFLLAAVIISVIVVSFAFTANTAKVNDEPLNFKDFTYEVKKETGAVMDYQVYTGFNDDENLTAFVELLADDFYNQDSDSNYWFLYGNSSNVTVKNFGSKASKVNEGSVLGANEVIASYVQLTGIGIRQEVTGSRSDSSNSKTDNGYTAHLTDVDYVVIEVSGQEFNVSFSKNKQVIFIIQKEVGDENYISVE